MNLMSSLFRSGGFAGVCLFAFSTATAQVDPELDAMIQTMPKDQDFYVFLNTLELMELLETAPNADAGLDQFIENIKSYDGFQTATETDLIKVEKVVRDKSIHWIGATGTMPEGKPDLSIRVSGELSEEEMNEIFFSDAVEDENGIFVSEAEDMMYSRNFGNGLMGVSSEYATLSVQGDENASGRPDSHRSRIMNGTPLLTIVAGIPKEAPIPGGAPPSISAIEVASITTSFRNEQMVLDVRAQFSSEESLDEAFGLANQYWGMIPFLMAGQKQTLMQQSQTDPAAAKQLESFQMLESAISNSAITKETPNILLSIPFSATKAEIAETLMTVLADGSQTMMESANQNAAMGGSAPQPEPKPEMIMDLGE